MIKAILLDIEGTTTPIDFVHKTLFPFAKQRIEDFVKENWRSIADEIGTLKNEYSGDDSYKIGFDDTSPSSVADYLEFLIDSDRKSTPLKSIQGKIWQEGYECGDLRSAVYDDVPRAFERWHDQNLSIAIYSSGSVLAQKLIFRYSNYGDLTGYLSNYFDTNVGRKTDVQSFNNISEKLGLSPIEILFVSDILAELDAAHTSGLQTALSIRPGNAKVAEGHSHTCVTSFDQLVF